MLEMSFISQCRDVQIHWKTLFLRGGVSGTDTRHESILRLNILQIIYDWNSIETLSCWQRLNVKKILWFI